MSLGEALPILLLDLYAAGGDPVPVELFHRRVREAVNERFGCIVDDLAGDVEQRLWRRDVTAVLDALELLGAVHLTESHDHQMLTELAGRDDPDPAGRADADRAVGRPRDAAGAGRPRRWWASWRARTWSTCACGWPGAP